MMSAICFQMVLEKKNVLVKRESKSGKMFTMVNMGKEQMDIHFTILSLFDRISVFQNIKLREKGVQLRNASHNQTQERHYHI